MSYDRPTVKDVRRLFDQYEELVKEYDLIRPGYNLTLDEGSKTYGRAYRVYEVADRSLWGKKDEDGWEYGSGHYEPTLADSYLRMTAQEAMDNLIIRRRMIYDMVRSLGTEKTNPILDCGHFPTPQPHGSIETGKAEDADGRTLCFSCADDAMRRTIENPETQRVTLYVESKPWPEGMIFSRLQGFNVTTWNGTPMGRVTNLALGSHTHTPTGGKVSTYWIQVVMEDGSEWYGRTSGPGTYVNLKRKKVNK